MAGGIMLFQYLIMFRGDHDAIFDDDAAKWSAMTKIDAFQCFFNGFLHKRIL